MTFPSTPGLLARAQKLTLLALQLGRVERATRHPDGVRPETDTDHTVSLAVVACDLAPSGLSRARIAEFATVHDLVEAYAGDTQTLNIDAAGRAAKDARERAALERLRAEFGARSWLVRAIEEYECQISPEARYVRLLDKVIPKLTHLANGCAAARAITDREGFIAAHEAQYRKLAEDYASDWWAPPFLALLRAAVDASEAAWPAEVPDAR